jgi:hypothetical protein
MKLGFLHRLFGLGAAKPKTAEPPESGHHEPAAKAKTTIRAEGGSKKGRNSTARKPAARLKQRPDTQKLEGAPPTGPAAGPGVRPPDERQPGTRKKGAPEDEPVPQSLQAEIKFGKLDGNAVRFTDLEAWWLVDGAWRPISPADVLLNAPVLSEARFNELFPEVPRLPNDAFQPANGQAG